MSDRFGTIPIQPPESSRPDKKPSKRASRGPVARTARPKTKKPSIIRTWGWLVALVAIFALYTIFGFWGIPYYVTKLLPEHFQAQTGMVLQPTAVTFNPFSFRLATGEVRLVAPADDRPIISLRSFEADVAPVTLLRLNMACTAVTVHELQLNIAREAAGTYNFQRIFGEKRDRDLSEIFDFSDLPFSFSLNNISIKNSGITFHDVPTGKTHTIEKMHLDLPTFSNSPFQADQYLRPHFSAIVNGSPIELSGQARMADSPGEDQATRLAMDVHDLDLTLYSGYLPVSLPMEFTKGVANGTVNLLFNPQAEGTDKLSIGFQLRISEAELNRQDPAVSISVPTARLNGTLLANSRTIHFTEITVKEPTLSSFAASMPAAGKHPAKQEGPTSPSAADPTAGTPYTLIVDLLHVDNGTMRRFPEKKTSRPTSTWNALQLRVKDYRSATEKQGNLAAGSFSLKGEKDGSASHFSWQGNFSSPNSITGKLTLLKMNGQDLLKIVDPAPPLQLQGVADLQGQLILMSHKELSPPFRYKLVDAEVTVENFALMDQDKSILTAPLVKFAPLSFTDDALHFGKVQLQKADAQFISGRIPQFFTSFAAGKYRLQSIDFDGQVTFTSEKKPDQQLTFTEVSCKAEELDSSQKAPDNLTVIGKTAAGGMFKAQGGVSLAPFSTTMQTAFRELPAKNVFSFFSTSSFLRDLEGNLTGNGQLMLPPKNFAGELQLTDFTNKDAKGASMSWQKATFQDVNYSARPLHLGMTSTKIDQARFSWDITPDDNGPMHDLAGILKKYVSQGDTQAVDKAPIAASPVDIEEIAFTNSTIQLHDHRLTPQWQAEVVDFAGKISDIGSTGTSGESAFSFTGKLDNIPFTIEGAMDAMADDDNGAFRFSLANYPLASFHQQLAAQTDVDTSNGELTLTLDCSWQDGKYKSSGNVVFADVQPLEAASDSALPLALLTGDDNTFQLDFDFFRSQPVAKTTLFNELLASFQKQIVKSAVSPLLLASGDFSDLIGNEFVEFRPGEFTLTDKGRDVLIRYGALLIAHPHVGLALSGGVDQTIDRDAMKQRLTTIEQQRVEQENEKLFTKWQEKKNLYEKNLAEQQKKMAAGGNIVVQDIPADILAGFTPIQPVPVVVDEAMLLELQQNRINIISAYLTSQAALQDERISIVTPDSLADNPHGTGPAVTIALTAISE
ncbi:DUF748 domain-containing protein [Desulfocastanea catecholica]